LFASHPGDNFVPELYSALFEVFDCEFDIFYLQLETVPSSGVGRVPSGTDCPAPPATWTVDLQLRSPSERGKFGFYMEGLVEAGFA